MVLKRSVRRELHLLATLLGAATLIVGVMGVVFINGEKIQIARAIEVISPAVAVNSALLNAMTDAEDSLSGYRDIARQRVEARLEQQSNADQARLQTLLSSTQLSARDRADYTGALITQADTIANWWRFIGTLDNQANSGLSTLRAGTATFDLFRTANAAITGHLNASQASIHAQAYRTLTVSLRALLAGTLLALLADFAMTMRMSRTVVRPVLRLRQIVQRQYEGETSARADDARGSAEARSLAATFNAMTARNAELGAEQAEALRLQRAVFAVGHAIGHAVNGQQAMDIACAELGVALRARRVIATTMNAVPKIIADAQWHVPELDDLPGVLDDLAPRLWLAADELWNSSGRLIIADLAADLAADETGQQDWARRFHRDTGATSLIMVPVGLDNRVIGALYVVTDAGPHQWTETEAVTVQQFATYLARAITQVEREAQREEHASRLENLDRQKTEFLSTVSHELRTPLTSIQGYLELLCDGDAGELSAGQQHMLGIIERNTLRLRGLIEDILVLNKIESGGLSQGMAEVSFGELIVHTAEELQPLADKAGVRLHVRTEASPAHVIGDPTQLQRMLVNLLSNAIKFTPRDGEVRMSYEIDQAAREAVITCQDTGIGIPKADLKYLFTLFFRASNATRQAIPGTGLGLAIVAAIVDVHHGSLALDSVEGKGTTITARFPVLPGSPAASVP